MRTPPRPGRYTPGSTVTHMSGTMILTDSRTRLGDHLAGRGVDLCAGRAHHAGGPAGGLRLLYQPVDLALPVGGRAEHERPCHVRVIAIYRSPEVEFDEVPGRQGRSGRPMVRNCAVRAGRHDGLERRIGRAQLPHPLIQVQPHLTFGPAGADAAGLDQLGQCTVGHRTGLSQGADLGGVLHRAQALDQAAGRREFHRAWIALGTGQQGGMRGHGHRIGLEPDDAFGCAGEKCEVARPADQPRQVRDFVGRLGGVAAVGTEHRPRSAVGRYFEVAVRCVLGIGADDQQCRVGAGEAGQVANVDQIGDEQRVDPTADQRRTNQGSSPMMPGGAHDPRW
jgi:hypothetical protein